MARGLKTERRGDPIEGLVIQWYRKFRFLEQQEVAAKAGLSKAYLSGLESGRFPLHDRLEKRIVDAIDSMEELTRQRTLAYAATRICGLAFQDAEGTGFCWRGSYSADIRRLHFEAADIVVDIESPVFEAERTAVRTMGVSWFSGRVKVEVPGLTSIAIVLVRELDLSEFLAGHFPSLSPSQRTCVTGLLLELRRTLELFWRLRPDTLSRQLDEILRNK